MTRTLPPPPRSKTWVFGALPRRPHARERIAHRKSALKVCLFRDKEPDCTTVGKILKRQARSAVAEIKRCDSRCGPKHAQHRGANRVERVQSAYNC